MKAVLLALVVLLGLFCASALAMESTAEVSAVNSAVLEAESMLAPDSELDLEEPFLYDEDELAFLEMETELEGESDADADDMEESFGLDEDAGAALFFEMGADMYADADADVDAEFDAEVDSEQDADVEVEHESDAEFGAVTVHDADSTTEVDADAEAEPIVTQQMEVEEALKDFGFAEVAADEQ